MPNAALGALRGCAHSARCCTQRWAATAPIATTPTTILSLLLKGGKTFQCFIFVISLNCCCAFSCMGPCNGTVSRTWLPAATRRLPLLLPVPGGTCGGAAHALECSYAWGLACMAGSHSRTYACGV